MEIVVLTGVVTTSLRFLIQKSLGLGMSAIKSMSNVDKKLMKLERTLSMVQSLLQGAEDKQRVDKAWQVLLLELERLAYDADDLIDGIVIAVSNLDNRDPSHKMALKEMLLSIYERKSAFSMIDIQAEFNVILTEMEKLCSAERIQCGHLIFTETNLQTTSIPDGTRVAGRDNDLAEVTKMLLHPGTPPTGTDVSIISIVGMVGVGKTTLAQILYQNVEESFHLKKIWVSVTREFNVSRLTKSIIEAASGETFDSFELELLQAKLTKVLAGKKFLLVFDDLWNEKQQDWDLLIKPLRRERNGSKIIVTTRSHVVASLVATAGSYHLKCLEDQECFSVLMERARGGVNLDDIPNLRSIGMLIAGKCKGLPLAAKTLGSVLRLRETEEEWEAIFESTIWDLPEVKSEIVPALRLSYHQLPPHLKQCFIYCSLFPQNHHFEKDKLVQIWMAEGFIQPDGIRRSQDIGNSYFNQLYLTSFFQEKDKKYTMHDAIHDLAQSVSGDKFFRMEGSSDLSLSMSGLSRHTRHSSLRYKDIKDAEAMSKIKGLRTLLVSPGLSSLDTEVSTSMLMEMGCLRVLDLSCTQITTLKKSVGNLKHLRFLDLSQTPIKSLPSTIANLSSLQTLRLKNCSELISLPDDIRKLKNLRHLELGKNSSLSSMPDRIGDLTSLQTLDEFIVGDNPKHADIKELREMNMLQGTLCIRQLEKIKNTQQATNAMLRNKKLGKLELQWTYHTNQRREEGFLGELMPCTSLRELTLRKYPGQRFPEWMGLPSFGKLTSICFSGCENSYELPCLGQLPKLKSLTINKMNKVTSLGENFYGGDWSFCSLEILELRDMRILTTWSGIDDHRMSHLRVLTLVKCSQLSQLPSLHYFRHLEKLKLESCPQLQSFSNEMLSRTVQTLIITECRRLTECCREDGGEDWKKIEHITNREIY